MQGDLMVSGRDGFQKVYDLTERVLPAHVDDRLPAMGDYADHLIDVTLGAHGFAAKKAFSYGRRGQPLRKAIDASLARRCDAQTLCAVSTPSGDEIFAAPDDLETKPRLPAAAVRLLSPFDNAVIQRERNVMVHDYDYQLECYVTASKRQFGYFCLPILYRDRLVGRVDCKAHRKHKRFEIIALFLERPPDDRDRFCAAFASATTAYATFNGCDHVTVSAVNPRSWAADIRKAFRATGQ